MRHPVRLVLAAFFGALLMVGVGAAISPTDQASLHTTMDKFVAVANWYDKCVNPTTGAVTCNAPTTTTTPPPTTAPPAPPTTRPPATTTTTRPTTTTTTPPPTTAPMPTKINTGPDGSKIDGTMSAAQFLASGSCVNKVIPDQVRDESGAMLGRTFTMDNCSLDAGIYYVDYSNSTNLPTWNIRYTGINGWNMFSGVHVNADHVFVQNGAYWVPCGQCGAEDHQANQTQRPMPVTITNSYFYKTQPPPPPYPYHSEALHVVGAGIGYSFTNVRFTQEGPMNDNITGALKFTGRDSTFRNIYLDFGGTAPASYFTGYWEGTNVSIAGCRIEQGNARPGYQYPDVWSFGNGYVVPPLVNCKDWNSAAPL